MNILFVGDVFASPGRDMLKQHLPKLRKKYAVDLVVVNGENCSHGKSLLKKHYLFLKDELKVDVITSGNHIFDRAEVLSYIDDQDSILIRPLNINPYVPGRGSIQLQCCGLKIRITNLLGKTFMVPAPENSYYAMDQLLGEDDSDLHLVDLHAEATAEKIAFAWNYDGRITAVVGTHTHVQTNDNRLLPQQTAFISDVGMTGVLDSSIGLKIKNVIYKQKINLPDVPFFRIATTGKRVLSAVVIKIDNNTKKATAIDKIYLTS